MHLKRIKNAVIGLMSLQFLLVGVQIWSLLKRSPSPLLPLFMMGVSLVVLRWGDQVATRPELTAIKELKWDLVALKNLTFEWVFFLLVTLIPLCGSFLLRSMRGMGLESPFLGGLLTTCLLFVSCYQFVLTSDLLKKILGLFEIFEDSKEA